MAKGHGFLSMGVSNVALTDWSPTYRRRVTSGGCRRASGAF
jgi:hypothetical protein